MAEEEEIKGGRRNFKEEKGKTAKLREKSGEIENG